MGIKGLRGSDKTNMGDFILNSHLQVGYPI